MEITYDNGTKRTWQVARKRVFSYENGIVIKLSGTHTDGTSTMITEWGINRFGRSFTTATLQPIVIRQDCDFRVTEGQLEYVEPGIRADILFGLDIKGDSTACPGNGSYYGKLTWTVGNQSQSAIFPY
ncbi:MAG: hypothetical protein H7Y03_03250 [Chitinophagaceae bacterium]|nr:hypothetical protein [Chitinophagaceae bacterium]